MSGEIPRVRMFAGPNGSGKSTLKALLRPELLGVYINPDEMEREMRATGALDLIAYGVTPTNEELREFFSKSKLLAGAGMAGVAGKVVITGGRLSVSSYDANSYLASVTADFLRQNLLASKMSFTFETVMSHPSKVALFQQAKAAGYRTYLYFIATDDPLINISRVQARVRRGGHPVPEDRIVKRYHASLAQVMGAIECTNRAYIFDNSGEGQEHTWLAEITEGRELEMRTDHMPAWFKHAIWDRITPET